MEMPARVGIPRGLLYYYYGDLWQRFLSELGVEVVVSGETTKDKIDTGGAVDEVCLPVKVFFGHARELAANVDYIFMPRIISVAAGEYTCPKIIGLPDMMRCSFPDVPPLIDVNVNIRDNPRSLYKAVIRTGAALGRNPAKSLYAWYRAWRSARPLSFGTGSAGGEATLRVAVISHPYIIHDRMISMDILQKLAAMGVKVVTPEQVATVDSTTATFRLPKKIFWTFCQQLTGAALSLMYSPQPLAGVIFITSFACGPDSLVGELVKRHANQLEIPFMLLTLDEHTAEAGFITRVEAFIDMIKRGAKP